MFVASFLVYGNTYFLGYSVDDTKSAGENAQVQKGISGISEILTSPWDYSENPNTGEIGWFEYRPIAKLTYAFEYEFFGKSPHISHLLNTLLYSVFNCLLLYALSKVTRPQNQPLLFLTVVLFSLHPIHSEVVANLKNREVLLSSMFGTVFWTLLLKAEKKHSISTIALAFSFLTLGVLSKMDAGIYGVLAPFSLYYFGRFRLKKAVFVGAVSILVVSVTKLIPSLFLPDWHRVYYYWENPSFIDTSLEMRLDVIVSSFMYNTKLLLVPHPLSYYYGFNTVPLNGIPSVTFFLGLTIMISMTLLGVFEFRKRTIAGFGIVCFLIGLFPFMNIIMPVTGIVADRYLFVASIGFCLAIASYAFRLHIFLAHRSRFVSPIVLLILTLSMSSRIIARNRDWKDRLTLYRKDAKSFPNSAKVNVMLGYRLSIDAKDANNPERNAMLLEALEHFKEAKRILPTMESVNGDIGYVYMQLGNFRTAISYFNEELLLNEADKNAHNNLGVIYYKMGLIEPSIYHFTRSLAIAPNDPLVRADLISTYILSGQKTNILIELEKLSEIAPEMFFPYVSASKFFLQNVGDTCQAAQLMTKAVSLGYKPDETEQNLSNLTISCASFNEN